MNSIKCDELELLEFFDVEPVWDDMGKYRCAQKSPDGRWGISFYFDVYEAWAFVSIAYEDAVIASLRYEHVAEIKKRDDFLILTVPPNKEVMIGKTPFYHVWEYTADL
ncbi:MAG: hypothetical protein HDT27_01470 [Subdoligranulum sp.]|nr:hypothetical protein [Subdoligranulum sp.]